MDIQTRKDIAEYKLGNMGTAATFRLFQKLVDTREIWKLSPSFWSLAVDWMQYEDLAVPEYLKPAFGGAFHYTSGYNVDPDILHKITGCQIKDTMDMAA